jgi:hypothetical protein
MRCQNRRDDVLRVVAVRFLGDTHIRRDQGRTENHSHTLPLKVSEHFDDLPILVRLRSCARHGARTEPGQQETADDRDKARVCGLGRTRLTRAV